MSNIEINNKVGVDDLFNGKTWIHGKSNTGVKITLFLITICTNQLIYSLDAINKLTTDIPVIVNVIMNVSPTNAAYNEMRLRCTTLFFVQVDEDMELYENSIETLTKHISGRSGKTFLNTFKLIDDVLGIGNPPIIDCIKIYNNEIMKKYPTFENGKSSVSSVDQLWHNPIIESGYKINNTSTIIGHHGKHRSNFDLFLRYCKITKSLTNSQIKTNNGHLCKLLKGLNVTHVNELFEKIIQHFNLFCSIDNKKLNGVIKILNGYVPNNYLHMYNIHDRELIGNKNTIFNVENFTQSLTFCYSNDKNVVLCIVSILCVITGNYEYSFDKYPKDIFNYFDKLTNNEINTTINGKSSKLIKLVDDNFYYV